MKRNFAVFILTHGRAKNVVTVKTLRKSGYTGKIYIVIDDEDAQEQEYKDIYGDSVIKFCKDEYIKKTDSMNPQKPRNVVVYARNCVHDLAKKIGLTHFLVLDDDYKCFEWKHIIDGKFKGIAFKDIDSVIECVLDFLDVSGALTVAMSQGGDFIGGKDGGFYKKKIARKAMNSFFCRTDRPFKFMGAINEDTNAYTVLGNRGKLFFTITNISLTQGKTQKNAGGLTEAYLDSGTYVKSFYTVMLCPSCVKVKEMGTRHKRMHHMIQWRYAVPKIISDKWKEGNKNA